jgi:glycerophosphoryl diester phosphodiesterase
MAGELGFDMVDKVIKALDDAGYHDQTAQKVMVQSTDSSVLEKFKEQTKYDLVYMVNKKVGDAASSSLVDIKRFASAVSVDTGSVFPETHYFTVYETNLVQTLQTAGLSVYVYTLMNEFLSQPYDFFSDATAQINAYVKGALVDGLITDFPATARRYKGKFRFPFFFSFFWYPACMLGSVMSSSQSIHSTSRQQQLSAYCAHMMNSVLQ